MKTLVFSITFSFSALAIAGEDRKISKSEYVDQWSGVAVEQMLDYGIPASIILAQGILESGSGNSELAVKGNNHFGIKCHGWKGKKMYQDDDEENECFRVYKYAEDSYRDHSLFLTEHKRYAFLFDFPSDDYKAWAKGLKKAGYATNPKYPNLLIDIIEDLNLTRFDLSSKPTAFPIAKSEIPASPEQNKHIAQRHEKGVKYVIVENGDTYYRIAQEFGLTLGQLYRYNDFEKSKAFLEVGDLVYVQPKKRRNLFVKEEIVVEKEITIEELSQQYATKAKTIRRLNNFSEDTKVIAQGEKVTLR